MPISQPLRSLITGNQSTIAGLQAANDLLTQAANLLDNGYQSDLTTARAEVATENAIALAQATTDATAAVHAELDPQIDDLTQKLLDAEGALTTEQEAHKADNDANTKTIEDLQGQITSLQNPPTPPTQMDATETTI